MRRICDTDCIDDQAQRLTLTGNKMTDVSFHLITCKERQRILEQYLSHMTLRPESVDLLKRDALCMARHALEIYEWLKREYPDNANMVLPL